MIMRLWCPTARQRPPFPLSISLSPLRFKKPFNKISPSLLMPAALSFPAVQDPLCGYFSPASGMRQMWPAQFNFNFTAVWPTSAIYVLEIKTFRPSLTSNEDIKNVELIIYL